MEAHDKNKNVKAKTCGWCLTSLAYRYGAEITPAESMDRDSADHQFCLKEHKCNESTVAMSSEEHEDHNWLRVIASYLMKGPYKKEGVYKPANNWERQVSLR
jgi:hypothetical protein